MLYCKQCGQPDTEQGVEHLPTCFYKKLEEDGYEEGIDFLVKFINDDEDN